MTSQSCSPRAVNTSQTAALRDQPDLFGSVASGSTAFRLIDAIGERELEAISAARAKARERAVELGARLISRGCDYADLSR